MKDKIKEKLLKEVEEVKSKIKALEKYPQSKRKMNYLSVVGEQIEKYLILKERLEQHEETKQWFKEEIKKRLEND